MIIGIGGVSRAGKTSLSFRLRDRLKQMSYECFVLHQDDYVTPKESIPRVRDKIDWEDPSSLDFARFKNLIAAAAEKNDVVIAEGILVFYESELAHQMHKHIMLEITWEQFYERKQTDFRWNTEVEPDWYLSHIWDQHHRNGYINFPDSGLILDGSKPVIMDELTTYCLDM